jgi:hypothetical protein
MPATAHGRIEVVARGLRRLFSLPARMPAADADTPASRVIDVTDGRQRGPGRAVDRRSVEQAIRDVDRSFTSVYLTVVSIIQGSVFAYFSVVIADHHDRFDRYQWLLALSTAMLYVASWHEYIFTVPLVSWIPTIKDSAGPYALGAAEVAMVHAIPRGLQAWSWAAVAFGVVAVLVIFHTNWRLLRDADDNRHLLAVMRQIPRFMGPAGALVTACCLLLCADLLLLGYPAVGDSDHGRTAWALFSNLVIAAYFWRLGNYRTVFLQLRSRSLGRASRSERALARRRPGRR